MKNKTSKRTYNKLSNLKDPNLLKSGHIKKLKGNKYVVVKRNSKGEARYITASKSSIKCDKTLKKNVSEMIEKVKSKSKLNKYVKSYPQALAIAYTKTAKKYPKCDLLKTKKTKKQEGGFFSLFTSIKKYQKQIFDILNNKKFIDNKTIYKKYIDEKKINKTTTINEYLEIINYNIKKSNTIDNIKIIPDFFIIEKKYIYNYINNNYKYKISLNNENALTFGTFTLKKQYKKLKQFVKKLPTLYN